MKDIKKISICFLLVNCIFLFALRCFPAYRTLLIEAEVSKDTTIKLYYSNRKDDFSEERAETYEFKEGNHTVSLKLSKYNIHSLRIDFSDEDTDVVLHNITYNQNFLTKVTLSADDIEKGIYATYNIAEINKQADSLLFQTIGRNSYIAVKNINHHTIYTIIVYALIELVIMLFSFLMIHYEEMIESQWCLNKKQAMAISGLIYLVTTWWFAIKYKGYFSFDEFYHISTLNPDYITEYNRANYINYIEKCICAILGKSDFVVKLVPMICGLFCFVLCMYLAYQLYDNANWIIVSACIITFSPYVLFNQFYIRMYIFLELVVMLDSVLFYLAAKTKKKSRYLCLLTAMGITSVYCFNTGDFTSIAMLFLTVVAFIYCLLGRKIEDKLLNTASIKYLKILMTMLITVIVLFAVLVKQGILDFNILHEIIVLSTGNVSLADLLREFYHSDDLALLKFIFLSNFFVIIPFLISAYSAIKKGEDSKKVLFILAGLPLMGYLILFYDSYQIRSYIAFWPIVCVLSFLVFDTYKLKKMVHLLIIVASILLSINIDNGFWVSPQIPDEVISMDLGQASACAKEYKANGYEIVTMMTSETQSAYFDLLDVNINLNTIDRSRNESLETYMENNLNLILNGDKQYVILMDNNSRYYYNKYKKEGTSKCQDIIFGGGASCIVVN